MKKKDFDKLVASVKQAGKIKRGKLKPSRIFRFKPADIKAIREKLGVSQSEFALMIGVSVGDTTLGTTIANLGMTDVKFPKPVFLGDTLRSVTTVREKRESKSRPEAGIVVFEHRAINQRDEEVASCLRSAFMKKRPA